jgi:hypothetical protein
LVKSLSGGKVNVALIFQFFTKIPGLLQRGFYGAGRQVCGYHPQHFIIIVQVYIPAHYALQRPEQFKQPAHMFFVFHIGFKNKYFHNSWFKLPGTPGGFFTLFCSSVYNFAALLLPNNMLCCLFVLHNNHSPLAGSIN